MRVARWIPFTVFLLAAGCGGGGGGGGGGARSGAELIAEWVARWSDDAARDTRVPPRIKIPPPPAVPLTNAALRVRTELRTTVTDFAGVIEGAYRETPKRAHDFAKELVCEWFGWYVEDPTRTVPDAPTFEQQFIKAGLKVTFNAPPSQQLRESIDTFRTAIVNARGELEAARNAAIAAACSLP